HAECRWYPERNLTIIVFTNLELYDESGSGLGLHKRIIASALERIDRGETVPLPPVPNAEGANEAYLSRFTSTHPMAGATVETGYPQLRFSADGQDAINRVLGCTMIVSTPTTRKCRRYSMPSQKKILPPYDKRWERALTSSWALHSRSATTWRNSTA